MRLLVCAVLALMTAAQAGQVASPRGSTGPLGPVAPIGGLVMPIWSTTDLKTHAALPSGEVTVAGKTVKWQIGNYWSDGLQIYGLVCTPPASQTRYPVAILNHGLERVPTGPIRPKNLLNPSLSAQYVYPAIADRGFTGCTTMAAYGWLTAISTYRGESINKLPFSAISDGKVELCRGEVDDVLNLLSAVSVLPGADAGRVLMWGHSHGSCITERAIERGAKVQIAVSIDGPTDFPKWTFDSLYSAPDDAGRSSALEANNPAALGKLQFLRIQAEADEIVPARQGCELAAAIPVAAAYYLNSKDVPLTILPGKPLACAGFAIPWQHGVPVPGGAAWAASTFLMYSDMVGLKPHAFILVRAWPKVASFINAFAQSNGWPASVPDKFFMIEN